MRHWISAAALLLALGPAAAQDYPTKPITIVVPAAAGGPTDTISRITAQAMSKLLGQSSPSRTSAVPAAPSAPPGPRGPSRTATRC